MTEAAGDVIRFGESTTRAGLPDEVVTRLVRRADAEQNRYVSLARIAAALEAEAPVPQSLPEIACYLERIASALERAFPPPEPEEPEGTEDALAEP